MTTVFSRIIAGELPARFVWSDDRAVAFLSVNPLGPGHALVVPRAEVDQWVDAPPELLGHLTAVAHAVGEAVRAVWAPPRVGLLVAGFEVPHLHLHVFPAADMAAFDFANAAATVDADEQDRHAEALRAALRAAGHDANVPTGGTA
jgi:histidine triad (HIT) family protein